MTITKWHVYSIDKIISILNMKNKHLSTLEKADIIIVLKEQERKILELELLLTIARDNNKALRTGVGF